MDGGDRGWYDEEDNAWSATDRPVIEESWAKPEIPVNKHAIYLVYICIATRCCCAC